MINYCNLLTHFRYDLKEACAKFCNHQKSALAMFKHTLQNSQELKNFCYQAEMHPVAKRLDLDQLIGSVVVPSVHSRNFYKFTKTLCTPARGRCASYCHAYFAALSRYPKKSRNSHQRFRFAFSPSLSIIIIEKESMIYLL